MRKFLFLVVLFVYGTASAKDYSVESPDGRTKVYVNVNKDKIEYSLFQGNDTVLLDTRVALELSGGEILGVDPVVKSSKIRKVDQKIVPAFYKKNEIIDRYNQLTIAFKGDWELQFRVYNDGAAYRFVTARKGELVVVNETAGFNFVGDPAIYAPIVRPRKAFGNDLEKQYMTAFESQYQRMPVSQLPADKLMFLPVLVELSGNKKALITEADLESYPGMFLRGNDGVLNAQFATYPKSEVQGGHNELQLLVKEREAFIAKTKGTRTFPWRVVAVSEQDADLLNSDMVYKLASPSRIEDISWVKPGKVAWDWWSDWNLEGVDFVTGVNNATYKKYIDFAAANGLEYVIMDEGWAVNKKADLFAVIPEINLEELVSYGKERNVGIVLWAGYYPMEKDMEKICKHYADMGIKGFKVDFMDRDDQKMVDFYYRLAETAARHKLFVDYHGAYKPTGLNRTYPNVLNYEGVYGLENMKWDTPDVDQMEYDVTMPFIRMFAGPVDYTQGAMRNAIKSNYYPINSEPMSQGTRCHQLALFTVLDAPFNMLCDTPTAYEREPECSDYIVAIPTVWDETKIVDAKVGEYIITARRKGDVWYIAGLTDWNPRQLSIDFSFLGDGNYEMELFTDGVNADKKASDYKKEIAHVTANRKLDIKLAPGGGFSGRIVKK